MARGIIILGAPGFGTTTLGKAVAKELEFQHFDLAVLNWAPLDTRLKRIDEREFNRFGKRILDGGDMYQVHKNFRELVRRYDTAGSPSRAVHEKWAAALPCTVIHIDGTKPIKENTAEITKVYLSNLYKD